MKCSQLPQAPVSSCGQHVAPEGLAAHMLGSKDQKRLARAEQELLQTTRDFHACKQEEGQSVSSYVLRMKGYIDNLERLGHPVTLGLAVSLILIGLRKEFDGFVQNYNMHSLGKTVNELHAMLKLHEQTLNLPKNNAPALHAIRAGKVQKGHWKRNCPQYLAELLKKKKNAASGAGGGSGFPKRKMISFYYPPENKVLVARNAEFLENNLIDQEASGSLEDLEIIQEEDTHPSIDTSLNHEEDDLEMTMSLIIMAYSMNVEMHPLEDNEFGSVVTSSMAKTVGSKWLFKKKTDMDGAVHTYKARLVAKGYTQTLGIDYEETFSPVADIRAIRILIAIARDKLRLSKSQGASTPAELKRMQNVPYASAVGSIMYAVRCTRPDVAFAQNITSRFQQNLGDLHWTTVTNILKYLRNTKDMFLVYGGDIKRELRVSCYTDAGYLTDVDDCKSQTGYVFILNGGVVDWKSAKKSIFATSSVEAEYIAAFVASKESIWVRKFISGTVLLSH
ncbi:putative retrotransposon protein [Tanacetum coccineum]